MLKQYNIKRFMGLDQSMDEAYLDPGFSPDACNMDTVDGSLSVSKGYVKHILSAVPGTGKIRRLYIWRQLVTMRYIVIANNEVYAYTDTDTAPAWKKIYTYADSNEYFGTRWDFLLTQIGTKDYLIIANGERQMIKWDGVAANAELFGASAKGSDKKTNYVAMHFGKLFAAGDPEFPSRLYYSASPGVEGTVTRTIEDWLKSEASVNTSGGVVEIGDTGGDPITGLCSLSNQLLIFKRGSIYRLLGDRPANYRILRVNSDTDEMSDASCLIYGDTPFWMTKGGTYYFDGQSAQRMFNANSIRGFLSKASLKFCKSAANRDKLYFTAREGSGGHDNAIVTYDVPERVYMVRRGFNVSDIHALNGIIYMINDKRIVYRFDEGESYDGVHIDAYWNTPLTDGGDNMSIKGLRELSFRATGGGAMLVDAHVGNNVTNYRYLIPTSLEEVQEIPLKNEGRVFAFKFYNEAGSSWSIRGGAQALFDLRSRTM